MDTIYRIMDFLLPFPIFRYAFMKNALLALLLLTPLLALLGTMAVNKSMAFFSDALGHSALAGVGIGALLGVSNITLILVVFGIAYALLITHINRTGGASSDTNISVFPPLASRWGFCCFPAAASTTNILPSWWAMCWRSPRPIYAIWRWRLSSA